MDESSPLHVFFNRFKIALKNATLYSIDHPQTHQSVESMRILLVELAKRIDPLHFVFTELSFRFDDAIYSNHPLFEEIAGFFHARKIKRLTIDGSTSLSELLAFFSLFYDSPQKIEEKGGLKTLVESSNQISGIRIDELDYSSLLKGQGRDIENMREFLLGKTLDVEETEDIDRIAGRFSDILDEYAMDEWLTNPTLTANLTSIHESLKKRKSPLLHPFSKSFVKSVMDSRTIPTGPEIDRLKTVLQTLDPEDFAGALWDEMTENREFDALSLRVFSKLSEQNDALSISEGLLHYAEEKSSPPLSTNKRHRILNLLDKVPSTLLSDVYRATLSSLLQDITIRSEQAFDRNIWQQNYHVILLNFLQALQNPDNIDMIVNHLLLQWTTISGQEDLLFLKNLALTLKNKKKRYGSSDKIDRLEDLIREYIENQVLLGNPAIGTLSSYFETIKSRFSSNYILLKIFEEKIVNPSICELFFQSFPNDVFYFLLNIEQELPDSPLLQRLIEALGQVESKHALYILQEIYSKTDISVRETILRSLTAQTGPIEDFFLKILNTGSLRERKAAFSTYAKDSTHRKKAAAVLLSVPPLLGLKNRRLRENLCLIADSRIVEARARVFRISRRKLPWNRGLRQEARKTLEKLQ